jgi:multimeric flavodoxin WrbA
VIGETGPVRVLAFNCSPKMDKGNTAMILNPFLDGMREAGATIEIFYTRKLKIKPCSGEFNCWFKTPGKCAFDDDMKMLLPKVTEADIMVYSTPLYADGVSGPMKNLMDRQIPMGIPFLEFRDGRCRHPAPRDHKQGKIVLVSSCGLWELENFNPLLAHMEAYCNNMVRDFAGALLRPHSPAMALVMADGVRIDDIFRAAKEAGRQLIEDGKMSVEALETVSRDLMAGEEFVDRLNQLIRLGLEAARKGNVESKAES